MSWDDDFSREMEELDEYEYVNKLGIYAEDEPEEDPNDELYLSGLDPDELEDMDEDRRNRVIEDAGLDPDDLTYMDDEEIREALEDAGLDIDDFMY